MDQSFASLAFTVTRIRDHITELDELLQAYGQAQAARRESEEYFRLLVESVQDYAIFMLDPAGYVMTWNLGAERIKGYTADEITGQHFSQFYLPEHQQSGKPAAELVTAKATGHCLDEGWRVRKDGSLFWASVVITALYDQTGELRGFAKVTRDLTDRKRAEEELAAAMNREHEARIIAEQTAKQLSYLQQITDVALAQLTVDDLLQELLDRLRSVLSTDTATILLVDETQNMLCIRAALGMEAEVGQGSVPIGRGVAGRIAASGQPLVVPDLSQVEVVSPILRESGIKSLMGAPLLNEGRAIGVVHVGTFQPRIFSDDELALLQRVADRCALAIISANRYAAEHEARQAAEAALRIRDTFVSVASHELKTPLTSLLLMIDLLWQRTRSTGAVGERELRVLDHIRDQGRRLDRLVTLLLDLSRLETGRLRLECAPFDLATLTAEVLSEISAVLQQHTLVVSGLETPVTITGDSARLSQVIYNLLTNAAKYSPNGGQIEVRLEDQVGQACLVVRDHGIGIPPEAVPHLFERFYRAPGIDPRSISGMGLGLFISHEIVTQHGGTISVASVEGQGSAFTVCLPRDQQSRPMPETA
jgi:PAS domain S-box-containing protein